MNPALIKMALILGGVSALIIAGEALYIKYLLTENEKIEWQLGVSNENYDKCTADSKEAYEVSDEYQKKLRALNSQLAGYRGVREQPACVPVPDAPGGRDAAPGDGQPVRPHGVSAGWLLDFAAEGERYRLQLIACQALLTPPQ